MLLEHQAELLIICRGERCGEYGIKRKVWALIVVVDYYSSLAELEVLILDEADEMLNMGFKDALDEILSTLPRYCLVCNWSNLKV